MSLQSEATVIGYSKKLQSEGGYSQRLRSKSTV